MSMDLTPKDLTFFRTMAYGGLVMWAGVVLLLLLERRLMRPGISWFEKLLLRKDEGKLKRESVIKARVVSIKLDKGYIRVVQTLLIILSIGTPLLFLFYGPKKLIPLFSLISFIAWLLIPIYIIGHSAFRINKLKLERLERAIAEGQGEGKLET